MDNQNDEELVSLDEAAVILHEMYSSYVRAGFTKDQALELIKEHVRNAGAEE